MEKLRITCQAADTLPLETLSDFQGDLKTLSGSNRTKLRKSMEKYGFTAPIFIWKTAKQNFILDGHQRVKVLTELAAEGCEIPPLPVAYIEARTRKQAKEKLLHITSQYGEFQIEGFETFIADFEIEKIGTIRLTNDEFSIGIFSAEETGFPILKDGEKEPYQTMTFTLHDEQIEIVKMAIKKASDFGYDKSELNINKNGNALAGICREYL